MHTGLRTGGGQKDAPSSAPAGKRGIILRGSAAPFVGRAGSQWGGSETSAARRRVRMCSGLACALA